MNPRSPHDVRSGRDETAAGALSPAAGVVGGVLTVWRGRIAETQTLTRLSLSLLKASVAVPAERREHLGRMFGIEARTLEMLPSLDLPSLRGTTSPRQSGVHYRDRDASRAERYVVAQHATLCAALRDAANALVDDSASRNAAVARAGRLCEEVLRTVDLVRAVLYPRVDDPTTTVSEMFERAAAARGHAVLLSGETSARVHQVRGALRWLSEVIAAAGGSAHVHVSRDDGWLAISVSPTATQAGALEGQSPEPEAVALLAFAASILHAECAHRDGAWQLRMIEQQGE